MEFLYDFWNYTLPILLYWIRYIGIGWLIPIIAILAIIAIIANLANAGYNKGENIGCCTSALIIGILIYFGIGVPNEKPLSKAEMIAKQNHLEQKKRDEEKAKKQLKDAKLKIELIAFAKEKIPELYNAINETSRMREEIKNKKEKLTEVLIKLDKDYKTDEDIKRYEELLSRLNVADIEYDKMLREGYLQYKKFEISSDPAYEKMLDNYNNKAKQSLEENVDSFNKMRNQLSEMKNNE